MALDGRGDPCFVLPLAVGSGFDAMAGCAIHRRRRADAQGGCSPHEGWFLAHARMCKNEHMLDPRSLRIAIEALGGPAAASRRLGCSDSLVNHWLRGRREISAEKAWRLRDAIIALSGTLPGVAQDLKITAQQAELRLMQWRAMRSQWQPARGDKPRPSPLELSERRRRRREIVRRFAAGEPVAALAEEYGTQPQTIVRWARRENRRRGAGPEARE